MREAEFSYERGEGFVTFDTTQTTPEAFIAELARMTDYRATIRPAEESSPESAAEPPNESGEAEHAQTQAGHEKSGNQ